MSGKPELSTGPWKVECVEPGAALSGDNWLIAFLGEDHNGRKWYVTTDRVRASELVYEPEADAKAIVAWRNRLHLMRFYNVSTMEDLVDAQDHHVDKLQAKLLGVEPPRPTPREG